jgi:putative transposase
LDYFVGAGFIPARDWEGTSPSPTPREKVGDWEGMNPSPTGKREIGKLGGHEAIPYGLRTTWFFCRGGACPRLSNMERKKIRLDHNVYNEPGRIFSITICLKERRPLFLESRLFKEFFLILKEMSQANKIPVYAYCFMPDHLHILSGVSEKIGVVDFVREFKGLCTKAAWGLGHRGVVWQRSFYDHCLRDDEGVREAAEYILNNPVRTGLVGDWKAYSYSGSLVWEL